MTTTLDYRSEVALGTLDHVVAPPPMTPLRPLEALISAASAKIADTLSDDPHALVQSLRQTSCE